MDTYNVQTYIHTLTHIPPTQAHPTHTYTLKPNSKISVLLVDIPLNLTNERRQGTFDYPSILVGQKQQIFRYNNECERLLNNLMLIS